ncbi:MAG: sulfatase-like hydrolase/transferase, partial [Desulforhabdus sp.]|nr:sulfatase-like hydrolase/transferase [Desulforhabdus sp.]
MHLTRRDFLKSAAIAAGAGITPGINAYASLFGTGSNAVRKSNPNIIMIVMDTLRADHLSLMGYGRHTSPNLDEFSRRAAIFANTISPAPWTVPSFVSLMTGMLAFNHNQNLAPEKARPLNCTLLPELLSYAGYNTCMVLVNCYVENFSYGFNENYHFCGSRNSD